MGDIKPNQCAKLFLNDINVVLDCKVRYHENDRIYLNYDKSILEYAEYLQEGDEIGIKIFTPVGIIVFDSMILYSPLEGDFIIEYVESSPKIQRREYARVDYDIKITLEREGKKMVMARTMDISGGGVKFQVEEKENASFEANEKVNLTLYIPKETSIKTKANIVSNPNLPKNVYVLQYEDIEESDRERIIRKTHELQRREYARSNLETKIIVERKAQAPITAKTLDISGGGLKFEPYDDYVKFSKNEEVKITLYIPENLPIVAMAKIVDFANLPENVHVVQFVNIEESEREKLIKLTDNI